MGKQKVTIRIIPTPATLDLPEDSLKRLARITKLPENKIRDQFSRGRSINIVTPMHPRVEELTKLIRSIGFSVSLVEPEPPPPPQPTSDKNKSKASPKHSSGHKPAHGEWDIGDVIENLYEVQDIKQGGMGAVYIVRHLRWNTMMAVKSLLQHLRSVEEDRALFVKEAETWIDIGFHPNIAACYYVRNIKGSPRIFIEYVDAGSLTRWAYHRRRAGWDMIMDLMVQVGDGLGHAHSKGLVHRDVKPGNCMLTTDGIVKVTDFGLTKRRDASSNPVEAAETVTDSAIVEAVHKDRESVTAAGMGTPGYMAPEMWIPMSEVGPQADIYAFGVMFFEMCCGRKPFMVKKGEKRDKLALMHLKKAPPRPTAIRDDMPKAIEDIILTCLRKNPDDRYSSFEEIRADVTGAYEEIFQRQFDREPPDEVALMADALNNRAVSLMDLNHESEALDVLKRALECDPHHPEAVFNMGVMEWMSTGNLDRELVIRMEEVSRTEQYRGRATHLKGSCLLSLGDAHEAVKACESSISEEDSGEGVLKTYGIALIGSGRDEDAVTQLQAHLEKYPHDEEAAGWLVGALVRSGREAEARQAIDRAPPGSALTGHGPKRVAGKYAFSGINPVMTLEGHRGWVDCLSRFPKTYKMISGARDRTLKIWDSRTGEELSTIPVVGVPAGAVRVSPDESLLAITGIKAGDPVNVIDLQTGKFTGRLLCPERVTAFSFSPDSRRIVTVEEQGSVRIWDVQTSKAESAVRVPGHSSAEVFFDQDGEPEVFIGGKDRIIKRIRLSDSETTTFAKVHSDVAVILCASPDGKRLVSAGRDKKCVVWDAKTGHKMVEHGSLNELVSQMTLNPARSLAAAYTSNVGVKLWSTKSGTVLRTLDPGDADVLCMSFTADGARLMVGGKDNLIRVWDVRGRQIKPNFALSKIRTMSSQMAAEKEFKELVETAGTDIKRGAYAQAYGKLAAAQKLEGYERSETVLDLIWKIGARGRRTGLQGGWNRKSIDTGSGVIDIAFSPSAINIATAQADHSVNIWSTRTSELTKNLSGHSNLVASLCYSVNGREMLTGSDDRTVRVWDLHSGQETALLKGHADSVASVVYSPDGSKIASGSWDGTIKIWSYPDGALLKTLKGHQDRVTGVAFTSDSEMLLSSSFDSLVKMWEVSSGRHLRDMRGHQDRVTSVLVSPKGDLFISVSADGTARIWNLRTGTTEDVWDVDEKGVRAAAFSPDQDFVLTGGNDTVLRVWSLESGKCLREFYGHVKEITGTVFSRDCRFALSSSLDGIVMLWELDWEWEFRDKIRAGYEDDNT